MTKKKDEKRNYDWCEWEMRRKDQESMVEIAGRFHFLDGNSRCESGSKISPMWPPTVSFMN